MKEPIKEQVIENVKAQEEEQRQEKQESESVKNKIKTLIKEQEQFFYNNSKRSTMEDYTENSYYFIKLILKWKKHFIIVTAIAVVAAAVFSSEYIIKPKYKSFAIVYPANLSPYGSESTSEQLLQLLESADIRNTIINKFNLATRYNIDTAAKAGHASLIAAYESNVEVKRTEYESIEIKALDTDPQVACDMVNEIINALNLKARKLQRDKTAEFLVIITNQMNAKRFQLDSLNTILESLRVKYQILDYNSQAKEVVKSYLKVLGSGKNSNGYKDIDVMMRNLEEKGGEYYEAIRTFDAALAYYHSIKMDYDNVKKDLYKELTYTNIVTKPSPADKKSYPIRWLIVVASAASANLFLLLLLALIDAKKKITP
ncbi:MAG: hypothetical protein H0W84_01060 [Bacteroidetes bacterium]|nr:hypothetical protein [Bacteroidota bacterium]